MPARRLTAAALAALLVVGQASSAVAPVAAAHPAPPALPPAAPTVDASGLPPPAGQTSLVSANLGDDFPSGPSAEAAISSSGRYVAFSSLAADLVPNDTNQAQDVFVVDRRNGRPFRLPLPGGGFVPLGGKAFDPSIAGDGSVIAFTYQPPSGLFVPGTVVLAWDRSTGKTSVVSRFPDGKTAPGSREASVSGDGRLIAYTAEAEVTAEDNANEHADVFLFDRRTGDTTLVSISQDGAGGSKPSGHPAISADGTVVAFDSQSSDLVPLAPAPQAPQVFLRTIAAKTTELVSVAEGGGYGGGPSQNAAVSSDGHAVAFDSAASNLTAGDTSIPDVFVRDRTAGTTTLVSVNLDGGPADGPSGQAAISADGRIVAFVSLAKNLVAHADPGIVLAAVVIPASEVLARDLVLGDTIRISEAAGGGPGLGSSIGPAIGGNGRFVAFSSNSPKLVRNDDNQLTDVFLRDLPPDPLVSPATLDFGGLAVGQPGLPLAAIVSNRGWGPLVAGTASDSGPAKGDFSILADGCTGRSLHRTESCTITVGFTATAKGSRTATLAIPGNFTKSPRTVRLVGVGSLAVLELDPPVGNPGIVTVVSGSGFPAGATVSLRWSVGITPKIPKIVTAADGTFRVQVLVFHHDIVGQRLLVATRIAGALFPAAQAPMFVTTSPDVPSSYAWQGPPFGPPLIFRR
jgi:Tol biopolymer transport system component